MNEKKFLIRVMWISEWWSMWLVAPLSGLVSIRLVELEIQRDQKILWLCAWWFNIKSHHLVEFRYHEPCWNIRCRDIRFFIRHMNVVSKNHYGCWSLFIAIILSGLVAVDRTEVEVWLFLFVKWRNMTTWSKGQLTLQFLAPYQVWWTYVSR